MVNEALWNIVQTKPLDQGIVTKEDLERAVAHCKESDKAIGEAIDKRFGFFVGIVAAWKTEENVQFLLELCKRYKYKEPSPSPTSQEEKDRPEKENPNKSPSKEGSAKAKKKDSNQSTTQSWSEYFSAWFGK